jgi:hypothetical protein
MAHCIGLEKDVPAAVPAQPKTINALWPQEKTFCNVTISFCELFFKLQIKNKIIYCPFFR